MWTLPNHNSRSLAGLGSEHATACLVNLLPPHFENQKFRGTCRKGFYL